MRKFIRAFLVCLGLLCSTVLVPNQTDNHLFDLICSETPESLYTFKHFNVNILEKFKITQYPAICPISVQDITRISSMYGERIHPIYHEKSIHRGVDLASPKGTKVMATADGEIVSARKLGGYGKQIIIDHGNDYKTRYAHLNKILVSKGDTVKVGDTIGEVGSTGLSTGNHLHYEIIHHNTSIDPFSILPDTLQSENYLAYLDNINKHFLGCSDN